jgi:hypothetical protein
LGKDHALVSEEVVKDGENQDQVVSNNKDNEKFLVFLAITMFLICVIITADHSSQGEIQPKRALTSKSGSSKGMTLPFQPLSLTFHNVNYYVDMPPVS